MARKSGTPILLLINFFRYGHFTVYANNLTLWGLSRGMSVVHAGADVTGTPFHAKFRDNPRVSFANGLGGPLRPGREPAAVAGTDPEPFSLGRAKAIAREVKPDVTVLLNMDEWLFSDEGLDGPTPESMPGAYGIATFGHRQVYSGAVERYGERLKRVAALKLLSGVFTLDEHQAAISPAEARLLFLPDPFREIAPLPMRRRPPEDRRLAKDLSAFFASAAGPVIPILGKFDHRKNNAWILRQIVRTPDVSCVALGERAPSPDDEEIDALLGELASRGRAFVRTRFLGDAFFQSVLAHPRVPFAPLPYRCHYGSSAIQLMAHRMGKAVLVPEQGLMARRVAAHGLGLTHDPGSEEDFGRRFGEMLASGSGPYLDGVRRLRRAFAPGALFTALDAMLGRTRPGRSGPSMRPLRAPSRPVADREAVLRAFDALEAESSGGPLKALRALDAALPGARGGGWTLRRCILAADAGRPDQSALEFARCMPAMIREWRFIMRLRLVRILDLTRSRGGPEEALAEAERFLLSIPGVAPADPGADLDARLERELARLRASGLAGGDLWETLAGFMVRGARWELAAACFAEVVAHEPARHDCRLYLSDSLRYLGRYQEALDALESLASLDPAWPGLHHKLGQVLSSMGRFDEAMRELSAEPSGSPWAGAAKEWMARMLLERGDESGR